MRMYDRRGPNAILIMKCKFTRYPGLDRSFYSYIIKVRWKEKRNLPIQYYSNIMKFNIDIVYVVVSL